ncbi:HTTM domain-containing protein [Pedobacter gandavensis]|uniref:HTTM domain-containing protein n=1 Tax=Pedobacter gandavensis TaxID=2679963 RepID=UPI00292DB9BA|nr:HTTM domain-containing protein [Pedobacter gandavensis]
MTNKITQNFFKFFIRKRNEDVFFLPFFRISIGLFSFFHFLFLWKDFYNLYRRNGLVEEGIMLAFKPKIIPNINQVTEFLFGWTHQSEKEMLMIIMVIYLALCLCLTFGLLSRLSALLLLFLHLVIFKGAPLYSYGVDNLTSIALFYCFLFPVGAQYAIDQKLFSKRQVNPSPYRKILQLHLSLIYISSGFVKLTGSDWRSGEAIWQSVHLLKHNLLISIDYDVMAIYPVVALAISWSVVLIELFYPFLMFSKKFNKGGLIILISMHLGIAICLGLYYFSLLMILLSLAAFLNFDKSEK